MNSSTMNDFDDLYIIKKYQVFSNGYLMLLKYVIKNFLVEEYIMMKMVVNIMEKVYYIMKITI